MNKSRNVGVDHSIASRNYQQFDRNFQNTSVLNWFSLSNLEFYPLESKLANHQQLQPVKIKTVINQPKNQLKREQLASSCSSPI